MGLGGWAASAAGLTKFKIWCAAGRAALALLLAGPARGWLLQGQCLGLTCACGQLLRSGPALAGPLTWRHSLAGPYGAKSEARRAAAGQAHCTGARP
jgi:hypothetical protein